MDIKNTARALTLLLLIYCQHVVYPSDNDSEGEEPITKTIRPIDVEHCRAIADAISDSSAQDYFENYDEEEENRAQEERLKWLTSYDFKGTGSTSITTESEEDKILKIQKQQERQAKIEKRFIEDEINIRDKALSILSSHSGMQKEYMKLIRDRNLYPSTAIWELIKDSQIQSHVMSLLELIEDYSQDEYDYYHGYDQDIGLNASFRIFDYYLEEYNNRAKSLPDPREMDRSLHDLLHLCQKHVPTHPMSGVDDPEHAMCHISSAIDSQLLTLNLWYLDNPKLIKNLVDLHSLNRIFKIGIRFLQCTTYGVMPLYFDLGYLLRRKKFVGIKTPLINNTSEYQHIWIHPFWPLQIRITQNGKLTVGLIKQNPLKESKHLTQNSIQEENEIYKISMPGLSTDIPDFSGYVIPARHLASYQELWSQRLEDVLKDGLMNTAHAHLYPRDMNFTGMENYIHYNFYGTTATVNTHPKKSDGKKSKKKK